MKLKVLLTSTSFQDTPGMHKKLLDQQGFELDTRRGPLNKTEIFEIIDQYDALLCGDDELTRSVLIKGKSGKLKFISKYGVGLDKIDLIAAKEFGIPVANCPGVNQISVAEHVFALLLSFFRNVHKDYYNTKICKWIRTTGSELYGKTIGIIGLGSIGKEVAIRAKCFGLNVLVYDEKPDLEFINKYQLTNSAKLNDLFSKSDIISLHVPLTHSTENIININVITHHIKNGVVIVNTARGNLVKLDDLIYGLSKGIIKGYLTDVLDIEPIPENHPLINFDNVIITPHIGSRTYESVEKQGTFAVNNLLKMIENYNYEV
jgi:D-3-phosphoglycerate dehydrogenase / 2-oxoglutarate reductase